MNSILLHPSCLLAAALISSAHAVELVEVAQSPKDMWNGVTVSSDGRIFTSFPIMLAGKTIGVGEVLPDGSIKAYPGGAWNHPSDDTPHLEQFLGINAVVSDKNDQLWVVDPAGGFGSKPEEGKAKLVQIDIATDTVKRTYTFTAEALPAGGFINDVRLTDTHAILTDSSLGALVIINLESGDSWRVLDQDPRLKADPDNLLIINGHAYINGKGETPQMHVNTMDIDPEGQFLYFQPNGGPRLLRISLKTLCDPTKSNEELADAIEDLGPTRFNAGMTFGPDGSLYYSDIEISGITRRKPDGTFETLVSNLDLIVWPDASRLGPDGALYFPSAQVNRLPNNNPSGQSIIEPPFRLFKVNIPTE